ncbi:SixA phosphatase family protein [Moheibacter sediminis]|uniref:Phosphohistidine phosphatase n=1 Tax=Moheibacter sediminis TaxID=1434700 RepID=A0A1W1Z5A3_9FLAO|nr:histidine phosphatase family protein [Moheibacter sediminis]SMC43615.1 phosphohistidine phosphatase [Moheibacter sediminis]
MKQLILFRHAKSSWDFGVNDRERDLEQIGVERTIKSAEKLSETLPFQPEKWFSSPAVRARKTAGIAKEYFVNQPKIEIVENLYTFSFFDLLKEVKKLDDNLNSVIIFGHNEAFTEFVNRMGDHYIENLPTSGVAWLRFETESWSKIEKGMTQFIIKPKHL